MEKEGDKKRKSWWKDDEVFEQIAFSDDRIFRQLASKVGRLNPHEGRFFMAALADYLESEKFKKRFQYFIENVYIPYPTEQHLARARRPILSSTDEIYMWEEARSYALDEYLNEVHSGIEKVKLYISDYNKNVSDIGKIMPVISSLQQKLKSKPIRADGILLTEKAEKEINGKTFTEFLRELRAYVICKPNQMRQLLCLDQSYSRNLNMGPLKEKIMWTGLNYELNLFITSLKNKGVIKFRKWEAVCANFADKKGNPFSTKSIRNRTSNIDAAARKRMENIVEILVAKKDLLAES